MNDVIYLIKLENIIDIVFKKKRTPLLNDVFINENKNFKDLIIKHEKF